MTRRPFTKKLTIILLLAFSFAVLTSLVTLPQQAAGLSGSQFNAGNIIDDITFYNKNSMSASQIQTFLNAKVPVCDTNGTQPYAGTTRKAYAASRGVSTPFTCLKDYKTDTSNIAPDSGLCNGYTGKTGESAADIIYKVSQSCGISPKVLLVMLQKEQSLVTDDWPWPIQYQKAMGAFCPDTAPCDSGYAGFFKQVYYGAHRFKVYGANPNSFNYKANRNNLIYYHPDLGRCGNGNVFIQNQATASLYIYTPYQPNQSALNNLYGEGDSCASYGNRNFWRLFTDWFGTTQGIPIYSWGIESVESFTNAQRTIKFSERVSVAPGSTAYMRIKARNTGNQTWEQSFIRLGTSGPRDRSSVLADDSWLQSNRPAQLVEQSVAPGDTGTFEFSIKAPSSVGRLSERFSLVAERRTWLNDPGLAIVVDAVTPTDPSNSKNTQLDSGQKINRGEYLLSPDAQSTLVMQSDGNLVQYTNFKPVWYTGTKTGSYAAMQSDGNFVLYDSENKALWHTRTSGNPGSRLVLQTDGNLVLYRPTGTASWNSGAVHRPNNLQFINSSITVADLYPGQRIETVDRKYRLTLQSDGNLVLYSPNRAIWASYTQGKDVSRLVMQSDGNLVLYNKLGKAVWHTRTGGLGASQLVMQSDGNLVLYKSDGRPTWHTRTAGKE